MEESRLPSLNYYLDESDPDMLILRRQDGAFVAAFSGIGATREGILEAAEEDYERLIQAQRSIPLSARRVRNERVVLSLHKHSSREHSGLGRCI